MGDTTLLHVGNLTRSVREGHLEEIFGYYGQVTRVHLAVDQRVGLPRGFGYVQYATPEDADEACKSLHHGKIDGNVIQVTFSYDTLPEVGGSRGRREGEIEGGGGGYAKPSPYPDEPPSFERRGEGGYGGGRGSRGRSRSRERRGR